MTPHRTAAPTDASLCLALFCPGSLCLLSCMLLCSLSYSTLSCLTPLRISCSALTLPTLPCVPRRCLALSRHTLPSYVLLSPSLALYQPVPIPPRLFHPCPVSPWPTGCRRASPRCDTAPAACLEPCCNPVPTLSHAASCYGDPVLPRTVAAWASPTSTLPRPPLSRPCLALCLAWLCLDPTASTHPNLP